MDNLELNSNLLNFNLWCFFFFFFFKEKKWRLDIWCLTNIISLRKKFKTKYEFCMRTVPKDIYSLCGKKKDKQNLWKDPLSPIHLVGYHSSQTSAQDLLSVLLVGSVLELPPFLGFGRSAFLLIYTICQINWSCHSNVLNCRRLMATMS